MFDYIVTKDSDNINNYNSRNYIPSSGWNNVYYEPQSEYGNIYMFNIIELYSGSTKICQIALSDDGIDTPRQFDYEPNIDIMWKSEYYWLKGSSGFKVRWMEDEFGRNNCVIYIDLDNGDI